MTIQTVWLLPARGQSRFHYVTAAVKHVMYNYLNHLIPTAANKIYIMQLKAHFLKCCQL